MKQLIFTSILILFFLQPGITHGGPLAGEINLPVMGSIIEQTTDNKAMKYIVKSNSTKVYSPMEGTVYFVGQLKGMGLSVVIKNAYKMAVVGNLDRAYVVKNQYLLQRDNLGSVAYQSKITFLIEQLDRPSKNLANHSANQLGQDRSIHFVEDFQQKLLDFAKRGIHIFPTDKKFSRSTAEGESILSYSHLRNLLKDTGFPENVIPTMYCIAKWESGLNPKALNFNTNNTVDVGLFQINSTWFKKCDVNIVTLYDEKENSRCALMVLQNQGFPAWTTYNKNKNSPDYCSM